MHMLLVNIEVLPYTVHIEIKFKLQVINSFR